MKQTLHSGNSKSKGIEKLVSNTKQKEKKKNIEQILILCIVVFCLTSLYVVFTAGNNSSNDNHTRNPIKNETPKTDGKVRSQKTSY